jgi:hypothetical protein
MALALGAHALGTEPLSGDPLHDPPTVVVTTIGTVTSGPNMSVAWTYDQPQGDAQEWYRVEILDDALAVTHYDSGWRESAAAIHVFDVDAEGAPHESTDVTARVSVRGPAAIGTGIVDRYTASDSDPYVIEMGEPHCTITLPVTGAIQESTDGIDVEWTFGDDRVGKTQGSYRVRLLLTGAGLVVHDSGWVASTDTSYSIPVLLADGSQYTVEVQLKNNEGIRSD